MLRLDLHIENLNDDSQKNCRTYCGSCFLEK
jgi:hypothetical protein